MAASPPLLRKAVVSGAYLLKAEGGAGAQNGESKGSMEGDYSHVHLGDSHVIYRNNGPAPWQKRADDKGERLQILARIMSTPYVRGRVFEYRVRDYLDRKGFFVVRQARSAFPDIVALKKGRILLVECRVKGNLSPRERQELLLLTQRLGGQAYVALRKGRQLRFRLIG